MSRSSLTDEQVADIRAIAAEGGQTLEVIARQFGTTKQHVSRLVRGEQRQLLPDVDGAAGLQQVGVRQVVIEKLERAGINWEDDVDAAVALALAEKIDQNRSATTAQSAMAAPGLAKQLQLTLEAMSVLAVQGPRLGALRGDEAMLVARELGYPDFEHVDVACFDELEVIVLSRRRRLGAMPDRDDAGVDQGVV